MSIDTTMGLTPTGGIPMGTRSGDLDPGVLLYLLRTEKLSIDQLEEMLNHHSGLFALSAGESDVKMLEERSSRRLTEAQVLRWMFSLFPFERSIGAYIALLERSRSSRLHRRNRRTQQPIFGPTASGGLESSWPEPGEDSGGCHPGRAADCAPLSHDAATAMKGASMSAFRVTRTRGA